MAKSNVDTNRHYDSELEEGCMPLPPGMDARWFAREGINVLLNGGINHAEQLFQKYRHCSPLLSAGASLVDFITAAMTFEDEKMDHALNSLKGTIKMCQVDSLFEGILHKRPSEKWTAVERIERMIIWADCVVDFVKAGYHMRRAWKMYEKCHREIHGIDIPINGHTDVSKKKKKNSRTSSPPNTMLSTDNILILDASLSFGYGLIQVAFSIVPATLLKVCELFGFHANREVGLNALKLSSSSGDMKAPIARLTLLWYHTVVRPFCALDGNNIELGLQEASLILNESEKDFPTSAIFLYFRALVCRLRGNLDTALEILNKTLDSAKEQREIGLLCFYDKGWCHLMQLEWDKAVPCFTQLKSQSRWSEAYYTYLLAVTLGSIGESDKAYVLLKSVPKLVVRKTQLEIFLARKSHTFKKGAPTREEFVLLSIELLYLWNTLPQCSIEGLRKMLCELEKCESIPFQPLKLLIMGAVCSALNDTETAVKNLNLAACKRDTKLVDGHVIPYALYELATIEIQHQQNYDKAREILCSIKDNYSGYDFENRLNFRIHAALNNLDDRAQELLGRAKLSPPQVDGL